MKGLILKDFAIIKKYCLFYLIVLAIFLASMSLTDNLMYMVYPAILPMTFVTVLFNLDEKDGWLLYSDTLPVNRSNRVRARYITTGLTAFIMGCVTLVFQLLVMKASVGLILDFVILQLDIGLLIPAFTLPASYKFGIEKSRIFMVISEMLTICAIVMASYVPMAHHWFIYLSLPCTLALFCMSCLVSSAIYRHKDV